MIRLLNEKDGPRCAGVCVLQEKRVHRDAKQRGVLQRNIKREKIKKKSAFPKRYADFFFNGALRRD